MERLAPVLKQKFWILLGIGIVMTITGWWMATSGLAATIAARRTAIINSEKKVPGASDVVPNNDWSVGLVALNAKP